MTISSGKYGVQSYRYRKQPFSFFVWQSRRERTIPHADKSQTRGMNPVLRIHSEDAPPESGLVRISTSSVRLGESPVLNLKMPCDPSVGTDNGVCTSVCTPEYTQSFPMITICSTPSCCPGKEEANAMYHVAPESQCICRTEYRYV